MNKLRAELNSQLYKMHTHMKKSEYAKSYLIVRNCLNQVLKYQILTKSEVVRNFIYGSRVLLNGLIDSIIVAQICSSKDWHKKASDVEEVWRLIHEGKDRLELCVHINSEFRNYYLSLLNKAFHLIQATYGHGTYTSTEVTYDSYECSICNLDIRACQHTLESYYGGIKCEIRPVGIEAKALAIVTNPLDPRCRIWPWNRTSSDESEWVIHDVPILIQFEIAGSSKVDRKVKLPVYFNPKPNLKLSLEKDDG